MNNLNRKNLIFDANLAGRIANNNNNCLSLLQIVVELFYLCLPLPLPHIYFHMCNVPCILFLSSNKYL